MTREGAIQPAVRARWVGAALALALSAVVHTLAAGPASAGNQHQPSPSASCQYSSGERELSVVALHEPTQSDLPGGARGSSEQEIAIAPSPQEIVVLDGYDGEATECAGVTPTVHNTDSISVDGEERVHVSLILDLRLAGLAPGASPEADGSSEIEVTASLGGRGGLVASDLGSAPDHLAAGTHAGGTAVNLNAGEAAPDLDVLTDGRAVVGAFGGRGADRVTARGGPGFDGPMRAFIFAAGGRGRDVLVGSRHHDILVGSKGRDRLRARAGADTVDAVGRGRDRVDCGPGLDVVAIRGSRDRLHDCEVKADRATIRD